MIGDSRVRRWRRPRFGERAIDLEGERLGRGRAQGRKVIERGATGLVIGRARTGPPAWGRISIPDHASKHPARSSRSYTTSPAQRSGEGPRVGSRKGTI
jgi:hypothetical protein